MVLIAQDIFIWFIIGFKRYLIDRLQCFDSVGWATGRASGL